MNVRQNVLSYYDFDPAVVDAVEQAAEQQHGKTFQQLAQQYGFSDGPRRVRDVTVQPLRHSVEYFDLIPKDDYDETQARVLYAPMGMPVDAGIAMRAIRLFAAQPDVRLRVFGSPSLIGNTANRVPFGSLNEVANGDFSSLVLPGLHDLRNQGVKKIATLGNSYGADAAAASAAVANEYDINVTHGVWVESVAMKKRTSLELVQHIMSSERHLHRYVQDARSSALTVLHEARHDGTAGRIGSARYKVGMLRASNLAIGKALVQGGFEDRATAALTAQPDMVATIGWGTASELTSTEVARPVVLSLQERFKDRVNQLSLIDMHHAGGDNINLHAAIMLQGLRAQRTQ